MKYFKAKEFECPCCNKSAMQDKFTEKLDHAREIAGVSFILNSAYRCSKHNKAVRGKPNSSHQKGLAVDIRAIGSRNRFKLLEGLIKAGFHRIGIAKTFIHVDDDPDKDPDVVWLYL